MIVGTVVFTALSLSLYVLTHIPDPDVDFRPWSDFTGMLIASPIGWVIMGLFGPGWIVLGGLIGALKTRSRGWHWLSAFGVAIFGWIWPTTFWGWMGI